MKTEMSRAILCSCVTLLCTVPAWADSLQGEKAPLFALQSVGGVSERVEANELFAGKTTLLSFFAFWCKPCAAEVPQLRDLAKKYADRGFQVVLISLDRELDDTQDFVTSTGAGDLLVLWDAGRDVKDLYGVSQVPRNVRVDPDGLVGAAWLGYLPDRIEELEGYLEGLPRLPDPAPGPSTPNAFPR
jgi:thiol-disulfide isomerase/thioredoxin